MHLTNLIDQQLLRVSLKRRPKSLLTRLKMSVGGGNWAKVKFSVANQHATSILYWKLKWMASGEVHISWWKNTKCWTFVFKSIDKTLALDRIRLLNRVGCYFVALIPDPEMADLSSRFSTNDHKWHVFDALCLESRAWTRFWNWVPISAFEDFRCSILHFKDFGVCENWHHLNFA